MAVLGLHFCAKAFSSCGKWGPLFITVRGPLTIVAFFLLRSTGCRRAGSVVVAHRPSCSMACGIFPDKGLNPCPLHWQAVSQPLRHQGSPDESFLYEDVELCQMLVCIYWDDHMIFILPFVNVVYQIDWFANIEPPLYPWNKSHLSMVYDPFYILLDLVCWYFVEDFCIYIHQRYWPVNLFFL